jgi:hypothetical protein
MTLDFIIDRPPLSFPVPAYVPHLFTEGEADMRKQMPAGEARPLGVSKKKFERGRHVAGATQKPTQKTVDTPTQHVVDLHQVEAITPTDPPAAPQQEKHMILTYKSSSKNGKQAYYSGAALVQRFVVKGFKGGVAPASFEVVDGVFEEPKVKAEKVKLTAEERKAAKAAKPKPTLAELAQRAQDRANKLAAKAAEEAAQPSM